HNRLNLATSINTGGAPGAGKDQHPLKIPHPKRKTPATTSSAPAARRESILSFSTTRGRIVSRTKVGAEAGTAKLSGCVWTSARKAMKDIVMQAMARIRFGRVPIAF